MAAHCYLSVQFVLDESPVGTTLAVERVHMGTEKINRDERSPAGRRLKRHDHPYIVEFELFGHSMSEKVQHPASLNRHSYHFERVRLGKYETCVHATVSITESRH